MKKLLPLVSLVLLLDVASGPALTPNFAGEAQLKPRPSAARGIENAAALARFFQRLKAIKSGRRLEPVRIMHFGDSHTAADILTAEIRKQFQQQFGDGGPGYIVPRNPMSTRRRGVLSGATAGWTIEGIGGRTTRDHILGPAGISLSTSSQNERAWLETACNHFEVYYLRQPGGGAIDIAIDGASALNRPLSLSAGEVASDFYSFDAPADGNHRLEVRTLNSGKVRILGIVAEHIAPGVTYDVLGINGARATRMLSWNPVSFASVLAERKPDLIIIAYGTNEAGDSDFTPEGYARVFAGILRRLHAAAPQASLLVYGPPDRADSPLPARRMPAVIAAQRRAAYEAGAAFWSSYDAMGGPDSMTAWVARGLGQMDHVHFTGSGYARLGDAFYQDLMRAYSNTK